MLVTFTGHADVPTCRRHRAGRGRSILRGRSPTTRWQDRHRTGSTSPTVRSGLVGVRERSDLQAAESDTERERDVIIWWSPVFPTSSSLTSSISAYARSRFTAHGCLTNAGQVRRGTGEPAKETRPALARSCSEAISPGVVRPQKSLPAVERTDLRQRRWWQMG